VAVTAAARADDEMTRGASALAASPEVNKPRLTPLPPYVPGPPDRHAVAAAEDANVEPEGGRTGMVFAAAVGPAIMIGIKIDEKTTGTGGGFSFRIGRVANRDTVINLEVCGIVFPYTFTRGTPPNEVTERRFNQSGIATIGAQTWVAPTFWLRGGVGLASFTSRGNGAQFDTTINRFGGGAVAGAGVELVRRRSIALALEFLVNGAIYRNGAVIGGSLGLSLGIF
jgi:hypothetical protein